MPLTHSSIIAGASSSASWSLLFHPSQHGSSHQRARLKRPGAAPSYCPSYNFPSTVASTYCSTARRSETGVCTHSAKAQSAFPSAATPESPTVSIPSSPKIVKIPLPTNHLVIAPTVAKRAAVPYPQSSRIFNASTLLATTAQPKDLAAAGTSYSQMTMRIGKSLVEDDTRRAVLTEFGRGYRGINPVKTRGETGEDVRNRIERWKARVERAQRTTR
ncbi:hypothetical protein B7463_g665, partial [Scytalidium lignicola]